MFKRFTAFVLLILMLVAPTFAQTQEVYCSGLNDADCALYTDALSSFGIESADFTLALNMQLEDEQNSYLNTDISVLLDGTFEIDQAALDAITEEFITYTTIETADDLVDIMATFGDLFKTFNADVSLSVFDGNSLTNLLGNPEPTFTMDLALVNGTGYANMDSVSAMLPDVPSGWHGTSIPSGMRYLGTLVASFMPRDGSGSLSDLGIEPISIQPAYTDAELAELEAMNEDSVIITRVADADYGDEMAAVFNIEVDFSTIFRNETMLDAMRQQLELQNPTMSGAEIEQMMKAFPVIFDEAEVDYFMAVGLDSMALREISLAMNFENFGEVMSAMGEDVDANPSFYADFSLRYDNLNNTSPIVAPEGATVYPAATLFFGLIGQASQQG